MPKSSTTSRPAAGHQVIKITTSGFMVDLPIGQQDLANKTRGRHDLGAVGKHRVCKHALFDSQVIPEQTLEHRAQIGGWFKVASLIKLGGLQSRPVGDHASAPECAAGEVSDRTWLPQHHV